MVQNSRDTKEYTTKIISSTLSYHRSSGYVKYLRVYIFPHYQLFAIPYYTSDLDMLFFTSQSILIHVPHQYVKELSSFYLLHDRDIL